MSRHPNPIEGIYQCGLYNVDNRKIFLISDPHKPIRDGYTAFDLIKYYLYNHEESFNLYLEDSTKPPIPLRKFQSIVRVESPLSELIDYCNNPQFEGASIIKYDIRDDEINRDIDISSQGELEGVLEGFHNLREIVSYFNSLTDRMADEMADEMDRDVEKILRFRDHVMGLFLEREEKKFNSLLRKAQIYGKLKGEEEEYFNYAHLIDVYLLLDLMKSKGNAIVIGGTSHIWFIGEYLNNISNSEFEILHNGNLDPVIIPFLDL